MRLKSLAARLLLGAAAWSVIALVAGGFALSSLFRAYVERSFDMRLGVVLEGLVAFTAISPEREIQIGRVPDDPRFDQPFSGWYWQVSTDDAVIRRSRSLWDQVLDVPSGGEGEAVVVRALAGPLDQSLRATIQDISFPGLEVPLRYVVAADPAEIEIEIRSFVVVLAWALGALGLLLLTAMLIQVVYGLQPLRRMQRGLADIRTGRTDRLEEEYPAEIAPLAAELNALLANNAAVVERARTHVGNLAHALKTPLAVLINEAGRDGGPDCGTVQRQTELMRRQVDHYLVRARAAGTGTVIGARSEVGTVLNDLQRTLMQIHSGRELTIAIACPDGLAFRGERQDLEEMLGNLMDNGCKWARTRVAVAARAKGDALGITVDDDGPGLSPEQRPAVLERGARLDESVPGTGLGLSIVSDIAGLYAGGLLLSDSPLGGLRAELTLPAAAARPG